MPRGYLNVRATGGAVCPSSEERGYRERWSPFKGEGDGGCSKKHFYITFLRKLLTFGQEDKVYSRDLWSERSEIERENNMLKSNAFK